MVLTAANAAIVVQFAVRQKHASLLLTHLSLTISYPCVLFVNLILISSEIAPRLPSDLICRRCVPEKMDLIGYFCSKCRCIDIEIFLIRAWLTI